MDPNATTLPPVAYPEPSDALLGLCQWTSEDGVCYGTVIPILLMLIGFIALLAHSFYTTPQQSALQSVIQPQDSPLLPPSFKFFSTSELNSIISSVNDMPLKNFLPRNGLDELVEPCAVLGIANVKDLLRANRLALRDIGIGPKEARIFTRALERRVRLREKMQEVFLSSTPNARRNRAPTLTQRAREALTRSVREQRDQFAASGRTGAASPTSAAKKPDTTPPSKTATPSHVPAVPLTPKTPRVADAPARAGATTRRMSSMSRGGATPVSSARRASRASVRAPSPLQQEAAVPQIVTSTPADESPEQRDE